MSWTVYNIYNETYSFRFEYILFNNKTLQFNYYFSIQIPPLEVGAYIDKIHSQWTVNEFHKNIMYLPYMSICWSFRYSEFIIINICGHPVGFEACKKGGIKWIQYPSICSFLYFGLTCYHLLLSFRWTKAHIPNFMQKFTPPPNISHICPMQ